MKHAIIIIFDLHIPNFEQEKLKLLFEGFSSSYERLIAETFEVRTISCCQRITYMYTALPLKDLHASHDEKSKKNSHQFNYTFGNV